MESVIRVKEKRWPRDSPRCEEKTGGEGRDKLENMAVITTPFVRLLRGGVPTFKKRKKKKRKKHPRKS